MKFPVFFFILLFPILLFLSFNKHSKDRIGTYHSVIWADAAGYYVYLPMTFIYGWDSEELPEGIEERTGEGFKRDYKDGKLFTKYWNGTAMLQAPFFLVAHGLASPLGYSRDGFSGIYQGSIMVAAVFYGWLGCFLLFLFLKNWKFSEARSLLIILILIAGTHLYYYMIAAPGMSHVYSFFLFSSSMWVVMKLRECPSNKLAAVFGVIIGMIILCRPPNLLFLSFPLLLVPWGDWKGSYIYILIRERKKELFIILVFSLLCIIPQFVYWYWLSGDFILYSYGNEGFSNWNSPKFIEVLFSAKNGLFAYTPLYFLIIAGMIWMAVRKDLNAFLAISLFLFLTYILASWWSWWFGCSFGARNYVEYLAPFSIFLGHILFLDRPRWLRFVFGALVFLFIYGNLELVYYYDGCFYEGVWDWEAYWSLY